MKLKTFLLELYNTNNVEKLSIFTKLIKMQRDCFCMFQCFRENAPKQMKKLMKKPIREMTVKELKQTSSLNTNAHNQDPN